MWSVHRHAFTRIGEVACLTWGRHSVIGQGGHMELHMKMQSASIFMSPPWRVTKLLPRSCLQGYQVARLSCYRPTTACTVTSQLCHSQTHLLQCRQNTPVAQPVPPSWSTESAAPPWRCIAHPAMQHLKAQKDLLRGVGLGPMGTVACCHVQLLH